MEFLPVHYLKLRWLLSQTEKMKTYDSQFVKDVSQALFETPNHKNVHPLTIAKIEWLYDFYRSSLKGEKNV